MWIQVYHSNSAAWCLIFLVRPEIVHTIHHTYHVPSPPQYVHVHMPGPTVVKPVGLPRNYQLQSAISYVLCIVLQREQAFFKSCIQILDLYRQFLQNPTQQKKSGLFFGRETKKDQFHRQIFQKKNDAPPQIKTSKLPFSILFLCFLPVVLFFFFFL